MRKHWNYRIMVNFHNEQPVFAVHEVHYKNNKPVMYTERPIIIESESIKGVKWSLKKHKKSLKKDILYKEDKFPKIYKNK